MVRVVVTDSRRLAAGDKTQPVAPIRRDLACSTEPGRRLGYVRPVPLAVARSRVHRDRVAVPPWGKERTGLAARHGYP